MESPAKLNMKQGLAMNQVLGIYAITNATNDLCRKQSAGFARALRAFEPWALKMFDSSSKLQSGILYGNLFEFGSFRQCLEIDETTRFGSIAGKHCTLKVYPDTRLIKKILSYRNISERRWRIISGLVQNATLDWSVCIPEACGVDDVLSHFRKLIEVLTEGLNVTVGLTEGNCYTKCDWASISGTEISIFMGFGVYALTVGVITTYDFRFPTDENNNYVVKTFSARQNTKRIFARAKGTSDLDCIHGIRVMSTCYVIIGHRFLMVMFYPVINSLHIIEWVLYYRSTAITGGTLCVDTFFMISGTLVSLGYFTQASKGSTNWLVFYLYRYLRISVPLAIVVLWYATLMHLFGSGPLWNDMLQQVQKPCQEYWWATITHVQNYVHPFPLCMVQAWYLTCDMQYYFLSPAVLLPLDKFPMLGYANLALIYSISIAVNFYLAWINKYNGGVPITNHLFSTKFFQHYYISPHTRVSPYLIGLGLGYALHKTRDKRLKISTGMALVGWSLCFATMLASLVGCHVFFVEEHDYDRIESSLFLAVSRSSWTLGVLWMVWACVNGSGGPINYVLSLHVFRVVGRISYGMYLLHMLLQFTMSGAAKMPGYFSDFYAIFAALGDVCVMLFAGFLFTILFESPLHQTLMYALKRNGDSDVAKVKPLQRAIAKSNGWHP
ncbi:nose resistant to fluoxetine protein 6-like isoform X2 [Cylas formicarius]|uniref:nose resistant to fluoxetine protein 6-like isoform X2 n=1 Tax=Cylas formicarius TaxID=197179 RepID=UPI0029587479|nr:nose resistant to fluoxetine protein 6-like isoform X2 [Cylas formicarius]